MITQTHITEKLREIGVVSGDTLMVHSSLSSCGRIEDGAIAVIGAIREAVGPDGRAIFPAFTRPYVRFEGVEEPPQRCAPFETGNADLICTGAIPKFLSESGGDVVRSRHITHSWVGFGRDVEELLDAQGCCTPPCGEDSPPAMTLKLSPGAKIVYFGCGLNPSTFLHVIEDELRMPYLGKAYCRIRKGDGSLKNVVIERHLPGPRDFYRKDWRNARIFSAAVKRGLEIRETVLGEGDIQCVDILPFHRIARELMVENPRILLA